MKNKEIFGLREALNEVDYIKGKTFAFAVFKNKAILDSEIEAINSIKKDPGQDYIDYEQERTALCETHSEKDENGKAILDYNPNGTQSFKIIDTEAFGKDYEGLAKKHEDMLKGVAENKKEFEDFLEKDAEVELKMVSIDDLPEDISASFLEKIKYLIA